jgi:hypothetical protein
MLRDTCPCARQRERWLGFKCRHPNGGPFSGDLGFFASKARCPRERRCCHAQGQSGGPQSGIRDTRVAKDGTFVEIGATFFADGTQGQIDVSFSPPTAAAGSGGGDYGYGAGQAVNANIVACTLEPQPFASR